MSHLCLSKSGVFGVSHCGCDWKVTREISYVENKENKLGLSCTKLSLPLAYLHTSLSSDQLKLATHLLQLKLATHLLQLKLATHLLQLKLITH